MKVNSYEEYLDERLNLNNSPTPACGGALPRAYLLEGRVSDYTSAAIGGSELPFLNSRWGKYKISVPMAIGMKLAKPVPSVVEIYPLWL